MRIRYTPVLILVFILVGTLFAQEPSASRKDEIEAYKVGFITRRLNLSSEEAKVFWPMYNDFQNEIEAIRKKRKSGRIEAMDNLESMSDRALEKLVDEEISYKQSELDVVKKYHIEFKKILKSRKVALLYKAQEDFKKELINKLRDRPRK